MAHVMTDSDRQVVKRISDDARLNLAEVARRYGQNPSQTNYRELVKRQADYQMAYTDYARLHVPTD